MNRHTTRQLAPDDPRHGTTNGYNNYGCRCAPCRAASSAARATAGVVPFVVIPVADGNNATRRAVTTTDSAMTREEYYRRTADPPRVVVTRHNSIGQLLAGDFR